MSQPSCVFAGSIGNGISHALEAGAKGAILKTAELPELLTATTTVAEGKSYLSSEVRQIMKNITTVRLPKNISFERTNRIVDGHKITVRYIAGIAI